MRLPCLCHDLAITSPVSGRFSLQGLRFTSPQVRHYLRCTLRTENTFRQFRDVELHEHDALQIMEQPSGVDITSYKAAWNPAQAAAALRDNNLYEAGGNIWWLNPFPFDDTAAITAGDKPAWRQVVDIQQLHFHPSAALPGKPFQHMFLVPMVVHVQQRDRLSGEPRFSSSLDVVPGHIYLYAWFLGMHHALRVSNIPAVTSLWRAGLTVSVQVRVDLSVAELALLSLQQSEQRKGQDSRGQQRVCRALAATQGP